MARRTSNQTSIPAAIHTPTAAGEGGGQGSLAAGTVNPGSGSRLARNKPPHSPLTLPTPPPSKPLGPPDPTPRPYGLDHLRKVLQLSTDVPVEDVCEEAATRLQEGFERRSTAPWPNKLH